MEFDNHGYAEIMAESMHSHSGGAVFGKHHIRSQLLQMVLEGLCITTLLGRHRDTIRGKGWRYCWLGFTEGVAVFVKARHVPTVEYVTYTWQPVHECLNERLALWSGVGVCNAYSGREGHWPSPSFVTRAQRPVTI